MKTLSNRFHIKAFTVLCAALVGTAACGSSNKTTTTTEEEAPVENEKTPFSARQLREAFKVGTGISLRIEDKGKVTIEEMTVTESTPETVTIATKVTDENGGLIEDRGTKTHTWNELRDHAKFPDETTAKSEGTITVPVGADLDTYLYAVTSKNEEGKDVQTLYHFAKKLPGPPVLMTVTVDGDMVTRMTMVGRR